MRTTSLSLLVAAGSAGRVLAQLAQTLTTDPIVPGKLLYVPSPGSTSSVAAAIAAPTLVYNCYNMPLICENVASWAKTVHPSGNGDLGQALQFYFDPDEANKDRRRGAACGCFYHDGCSTAVSNGKQAGVSVRSIAKGGGNANLLFDISLSNSRIILAGTNPPRNLTTGQPLTPRISLNSIPGRFFAEGVAFSCDEFPAATFINGGRNAKTSCALQSWQIFSGADVMSLSKPGTWPNTGKWPLPPGSGIRMEQDWQAQSHVYLRSAFGVGGKTQKQGWGTVYPFSFTTTTLQQVATKAYVVNSVMVTQIVNKRDISPTTTTYYARITTVVSGDLKETESSAAKEQPDATTESQQAKVRAKQSDQTRQSRTACVSSGTGSPCSMILSNATTYPGSLTSTVTSFPPNVVLNRSGSSSDFLSATGALNSTRSIASSRLVFPGIPVTSTISSKIILSSFFTPIVPSLPLVETSFLNNDAPHRTKYTRSSQSTTAKYLSTTNSKLVATAQFTSGDSSFSIPLSKSSLVTQVDVSSTTAIIYSLGASGPSLQRNTSRTPRDSSPKSVSDGTTSQSSKRSTLLSQRISSDYLSTFITSLPISSQSTSIISLEATMSSVSHGTFTTSIPSRFTPSTTLQVTASSMGNAEVAYSATTISSNVAAASGYAILLKADPSNKSKARAAQKSTHDSLKFALDLFHHSHHGSSPFGRALSDLIGILTKASAVVDAAVDASTPDDEEQDAEELVSDLEEAAQDAEKVIEEEGNDDDDETTTTSTTSTTSTFSKKSTSQNSQTETEVSSRTLTSSSFTSSRVSSLSSSVTSYAPTADPSACTLSFDISGDEDIEVGDDGYDTITGDSVGCVPVIGAGGLASGCGITQPKTWLETSSNGLRTISTSMVPVSSTTAPILFPTGQPKPSSQVSATTTSTQAPTTCIPDGVPWTSPTSWCDCGTAKYTMTSNCVFTTLPSNPLTPVANTFNFTSIPGQNKLPSCTTYIATEQKYTSGIENYCICKGTPAPLLTHTIYSNSSNGRVSATTDCSYTLQPTNTLWTPSSAKTPPTTLVTLKATTTKTAPHNYPVTTILVLITTLLPPPGRPTVYSTLYIDAPPSPTSAILPFWQTPLPANTCTNEFSNVDESLCWAHCDGGTCEAHENPFLNSEPWYVCSGCL